MNSYAKRIPLVGSAKPIKAGAQDLGPVAPDSVLTVIVSLRGKRPLPAPQAGQLAADREHLAGVYGADPQDMDRVEAFAAAHGLMVNERHALTRHMKLTGRSVDMARAFGVDLRHYLHSDGSHRGHTGEVLIPEELAEVVTGVFGLDDRRVAHRGGKARAMGTAAAAQPSTLTPPAIADGTALTAPQLAQLYDFPPGDGRGQCIAILEFSGGYIPSDLQTYFTGLDLPLPTVVPISVDGAINAPFDNGELSNAAAEVTMDIEVAGAVAPGAVLAVYFAPNNESGWLAALNEVLSDTTHNPSVLSVSWGGLEYPDYPNCWSQAFMDQANELLQIAAHLGITVCFATGDDGSRSNPPPNACPPYVPDTLHNFVQFPASSPYALAVGGTVVRASGGAMADEVVWFNYDGASAGGISAYFPRPAWQAGCGVPDAVNPPPNTSLRVGRGVPDVAAHACWYWGYLNGAWCGNFSGTSFATPLWAALIARINQELGVRVGYLNQRLYDLGRRGGGDPVCRDIRTGGNDPTNGLIGGFTAASGWDACTGWGSPRGNALLGALKQLLAAEPVPG